MILFPAIDLFEGKAVRLFKGDYAQMTVYNDNPVEVARDFVSKGATHIHLVDLEGAKSGTTPNLKTVCAMLQQLGADAAETADGLIIHGGKPLTGGTVDSANDHRIAMAAAVASTLCHVTVTGAEAVGKSYPKFWNDLDMLRGKKASP